MNKEEILIAIKEIQCRYSLPSLEKNFTDKDYACIQYEKLIIHLANQQMQKDKKIEKLNKIIDELENYLKEGCDLTCGSGITNEYIYAYENVLDKVLELKKEVE